MASHCDIGTAERKYKPSVTTEFLPVYYPDQQMHNVYINNVLYIVSTPTCFDAPASSAGSVNFILSRCVPYLIQSFQSNTSIYYYYLILLLC